MPSSIARCKTLCAFLAFRRLPQASVPHRRMAPKPMRLTIMSPSLIVPAAAAEIDVGMRDSAQVRDNGLNVGELVELPDRFERAAGRFFRDVRRVPRAVRKFLLQFLPAQFTLRRTGRLVDAQTLVAAIL